LSITLWFLISYPLYWASHTFITPDYFGYPSDYSHFREFNIFIYTIGALISIPISIYVNFKNILYRHSEGNILKEYCKILFTHSSLLGILALVFFAIFTYHDHHVSSIGSIINLVFFFSLIGIFDKYLKTKD